MRMAHLQKLALGLAAAAMLLALPATSQARTYFGFSIGVSNAPPPRVFFRERPPLVYVPEEDVYVADGGDYDGDAFFANDFWYVLDDGYWYRARHYRGPYHVVDVRYVPERVLYVPERHWRSYPVELAHYRDYQERHGHWGEPGRWRERRADRIVVRSEHAEEHGGRLHGDAYVRGDHGREMAREEHGRDWDGGPGRDHGKDPGKGHGKDRGEDHGKRDDKGHGRDRDHD